MQSSKMKRSVTIDIETEDDAKYCAPYDYFSGITIPCRWLNGICTLFNVALKENENGKVKRCKACLKADTMPDSPKLK
jgi:hypothetical protein